MSRTSTLTPTRWRARLGRLLVILDAFVIAVSSAIAYFLRQQLGETGVAVAFQDEVPIAIAVLPVWLVLFYALGCYRAEYQNQTGESVRRFIAGSAAGVVVLGFVSFLFRLELARLYVVFLFALVLIGGLGVRAAVKGWLRRQREAGRLVQRVIAVGAGEDETFDLIRAMTSNPHLGYEVVGFVDDEWLPGTEVDHGYFVLGTIDDLHEVAAAEGVGLVIVSPAATSSETIQDIIIELEGSPIDLAIAPSLFEVVSHRVTIESVGNVPLLHVDQIRLEGFKALLKRTLDLVVAGLIGLFSLPVVGITAVAIKLSDRGPVLFRQTRVGRSGQEFEILKFRTMVPGAEEKLAEVEHLNEVGHAFFKIREDPRVTRVGRFLRKWSIDELPQLWNVLRGDMSMVGPRPPLPSEVERYQPWQLRRLRVRPGITGVWQVSGRSEIGFDEAIRLDLFYIENWSLGYDVFLLGKTVLAVLGRRGAY